MRACVRACARMISIILQSPSSSRSLCLSRRNDIDHHIHIEIDTFVMSARALMQRNVSQNDGEKQNKGANSKSIS